MAVTITITTPPAGVQFQLKAAALRAAGPKAVLRAAGYAAGMIRHEIADLHKVGQLARSFREAFVGNENGIVGAGAFSDLVYARIIDEGGTIRPRTAKNLAIPVGPVTGNKWPRDFPKDGPGKLFFMEAKNGKGLLCQSIGKRKRLRVMFVLQPEVKITGSGYIGKAADKSKAGIEEIIGAAVDRAVIM